jgi:hypothetical protein
MTTIKAAKKNKQPKVNHWQTLLTYYQGGRKDCKTPDVIELQLSLRGMCFSSECKGNSEIPHLEMQANKRQGEPLQPRWEEHPRIITVNLFDSSLMHCDCWPVGHCDWLAVTATSFPLWTTYNESPVHLGCLYNCTGNSPHSLATYWQRLEMASQMQQVTPFSVFTARA